MEIKWLQVKKLEATLNMIISTKNQPWFIYNDDGAKITYLVHTAEQLTTLTLDKRPWIDSLERSSL